MKTFFNKSFLATLALMLGITAMLSGCGAGSSDQAEKPSTDGAPVYTFLTPKSGPLFPALLIEDQKLQGLNIKVETWDTFEELLARLQKNEAEFSAVPLNVGAKLAQKGLPIELIHVNTWGSMYLVSTEPDVQSLADLAGKTVHVPFQSGPTDILTQYFLDQEGLTDKVDLNYTKPTNIAKLMLFGRVKHAVLPEPFLSMIRSKSGDEIHVVFDYEQEWQKAFGSSLPQAGIVVNTDWGKQHPEEIAKFNKAYEEAVQLIHETPELAAKLGADKLDLKEEPLKNALGNMELKVVSAQEARPAVEQYLDLLLQFLPDSVGGKLPDEEFYYMEQK